MTTGRTVRFITLADKDHHTLGVVACAGADWTLNCGQCRHAAPSTTCEAAVAQLLAHLEGAHSVASDFEVVADADV